MQVRIVEVARNYARGVIEQILAPSTSRRTPPCPHFGVCGGCQLQHLEYEAQVKAKREFLRESLRRIGRIDYPDEIEVRTAAEFGYRARAEVKIDRDPEGRARIGFYRAGTREICEVASCQLLLPAANRELQRLPGTVQSRPNDPTGIEGFPTYAELLERYADRTGRDLSEIDYYIAFGSFRLAVISEGVYARYLHGAMGDQRISPEQLNAFKVGTEIDESTSRMSASVFMRASASAQKESRMPAQKTGRLCCPMVRKGRSQGPLSGGQSRGT